MPLFLTADSLTLIDSAHLISLPTCPTPTQWHTARLPVARRLTNAYSPRDFVLASVVRLHEVVGSVTKVGREGGLQEGGGVKVAGLGKVAIEGVEDVDLGGVLEGQLLSKIRAGQRERERDRGKKRYWQEDGGVHC